MRAPRPVTSACTTAGRVAGEGDPPPLDINRHVIALRERFKLPPDGQRFRVLQVDGAAMRWGPTWVFQSDDLPPAPPEAQARPRVGALGLRWVVEKADVKSHIVQCLPLAEIITNLPHIGYKAL